MKMEAEKLTETEMKAALQHIQFGDDDDSSNNQEAGGSSKLPIRDEDDALPLKNTKFRSIIDLYKCTDRLSPIEDEYNRSSPTRKDSSIRTNKKNAKIFPEVNSSGEIVDKMGCVNTGKLRSIVDIYELGNKLNKY